MSPHIFWLFSLLIIPLPFYLLIGPLRIISWVGGVIIIFSDSVIPNIYNLYWLDFANNNDGSWLIYLNYIICSIDIWLIIIYVFSTRYINRKRGYF